MPVLACKGRQVDPGGSCGFCSLKNKGTVRNQQGSSVGYNLETLYFGFVHISETKKRFRTQMRNQKGSGQLHETKKMVSGLYPDAEPFFGFVEIQFF